ncbi:MAG: metallophosphoesterase [Planctomycetia bacterium]|nr:metallophosphoesterase [Planctomycetia bacterium]
MDIASSECSRRRFCGAAIGGVAGIVPGMIPQTAVARPGESTSDPVTYSFSPDGNLAEFFLPPGDDFHRPLKLMMLTDTHLFLDDERGEPFRKYSQRMAGAYHVTRHWRSGAETSPETCFAESLDIAVQEKVDAIVMTGDMISFPSEAGVEHMVRLLTKTGIPFCYIAGNHDWHYEGMAGSSASLRAEWAPKRLAPLYQGFDPLGYGVTINGIRLLLIDDSISEILPEQLSLVQRELASGIPTLLFMHIPLYAPGRSVGYGCGHPGWNAASDGNWEIERRPRWPENGHVETTYAFRREVLASRNLLGVFAGHVHIQTLDIVAGKPLLAVRTNSEGAFQIIRVIPESGTIV